MSRPPFNLLCLAGSLRSPSLSLATCRYIEQTADESEFKVQVIDPRELDLPMYVPDLEIADYAPRHEGIERLIDAYRQSHAMVWASPTYHGTVSGVFKNMIDFAELLYKDEPPYFQNRPVGLISINDSTTFAAMRDCARELRAWLAPTHIELSASDFQDGQLESEKAKGRIKRLTEELTRFVQAHQS